MDDRNCSAQPSPARGAYRFPFKKAFSRGAPLQSRIDPKLIFKLLNFSQWHEAYLAS